MKTLLLVYAMMLGAVVGSFLNVVIARLPAGVSVVRPRSRCPRCEKTLAWHDNVPLLSFMWLRGRCRHCGLSISWRYPLVELLMTVLSGAVFVRFGVSWQSLVWFVLAAALVATTFLDLDHWWIPDVITWPGMAFAFATSFLPGGVDPRASLLGLAPALFLWAVAWSFEKLTGREGLGLGDVKLLAMIGLALGPVDGLAALLAAALQAAVVGSVVIVGVDGGFTGRPGHEPPGHEPPGHEPPGHEPPGHEPQGHEPQGSAENAAAGGEAGGEADDDVWTPPPRAIPFGPFLALATFEVALLPSIFSAWPQRLSEWFVGLVA